MALSKSGFKNELKSALEGFFDAPVDAAKLDEFCQAIADTTIDHFVANGVILPGTFKDSTSATITGTGVIS